MSDRATANKMVGDAYKIPPSFVEETTGLVVPERLRRPSAEVQITGRVDEAMFKKLCEDFSKIEKGNGNKDSLDISLASFGGSVYFGFAIFDRISQFSKANNAPVSITGYGPIMSMGAFIIQSGDIRRMPENSTMLIHPTSGEMRGSIEDTRFELAQREIIEKQYIKVVSDRIRKSGRSDFTDEELDRVMHANGNNGTYFTAQEAKDFGLIDEIV